MKAATNFDSATSGESPFVPMSETQMDSIKGGTTAWPEWFTDLVEEVVDNVQGALDYLDDALQNVPVDFDEDFWDGVEADLDAEGFIAPGDPGV